jgi:hypothetical protein
MQDIKSSVNKGKNANHKHQTEIAVEWNFLFAGKCLFNNRKYLLYHPSANLWGVPMTSLEFLEFQKCTT